MSEPERVAERLKKWDAQLQNAVPVEGNPPTPAIEAASLIRDLVRERDALRDALTNLAFPIAMMRVSDDRVVWLIELAHVEAARAALRANTEAPKEAEEPE